MGGDFDAHTTTLLNTIDTSDLCELLQVLELVKTEQLGVMAKRQNYDNNVGGYNHKLLDLCYDDGLLIFNGRMPGDESGEFTCLANGGCSIINYIVSSLVV